MFPKTIDDILTLLAITVVADKRVFAKEVDIFINSARNLDVLETSEADLSPAKLLLWFENNREGLRARMNQSPSFENWFNAILDNLAEHPSRYSIINRMIKISKADGELHVSEKALITLTAKRWNMNLSA